MDHDVHIQLELSSSVYVGHILEHHYVAIISQVCAVSSVSEDYSETIAKSDLSFMSAHSLIFAGTKSYEQDSWADPLNDGKRAEWADRSFLGFGMTKLDFIVEVSAHAII